MEHTQSSTNSLDDILDEVVNEHFPTQPVEVVGDVDYIHTSDLSASTSEEDVKVLELPDIPKEFAPLMIEFIDAVSTNP